VKVIIFLKDDDKSNKHLEVSCTYICTWKKSSHKYISTINCKNVSSNNISSDCHLQPHVQKEQALDILTPKHLLRTVHNNQKYGVENSTKHRVFTE